MSEYDVWVWVGVRVHVYMDVKEFPTSGSFLVLVLEQLGLTTPDYYYYLNQSGTYEVDGVDDVQEYQETRVCLTLCAVD